MPHNLRTSLTAWLQLAALPPTPMTNSRPFTVAQSGKLRGQRLDFDSVDGSADATGFAEEVLGVAGHSLVLIR